MLMVPSSGFGAALDYNDTSLVSLEMMGHHLHLTLISTFGFFPQDSYFHTCFNFKTPNRLIANY